MGTLGTTYQQHVTSFHASYKSYVNIIKSSLSIRKVTIPDNEDVACHFINKSAIDFSNLQLQCQLKFPKNLCASRFRKRKSSLKHKGFLLTKTQVSYLLC